MAAGLVASPRRLPDVSRPPGPLVTVTGEPAPPPTAAPVLRHPAAVAGVLGALVLLGAVAVGGPEPPPPPPPLAADLLLVENGIVSSASGVLVVPVQVHNRGPEVRLTSAVPWASPVRQEPATGGRRHLDAGGTGRIVAMLQPDCAMLDPVHGLGFQATLTVDLHGGQRQSRELQLELGRSPAVVARVAAVCRGAG